MLRNFRSFFDVHFIKFVLVGFFNTIFGIISLLALDKLLGRENKTTNLLVSYVLVFIAGHFVNRVFVWKSNNLYWPEFLRYLLSYLPSLIPSLLAFLLFSLLLDYDYILIQTSISLLTAGFVFLLQKYRVFSSRSARKAVFFDRDGIINELIKPELNRGPRSLVELEIKRGVSETIDRCVNLGFLCIVITNQPDVARGLLSKKSLKKIHRKIWEAVPGITAFYACTHDNNDCCECRKPKPGMLLKAKKKFNLNFSESFFVGDRWTDVLAAQQAGVASVLLINSLSDFGGSQGIKPPNLHADYEINKLTDLLKIIS